MGIQSKIRLGFVAIGVLLFLSGLISSLELNRFNRHIDNVLAGSQSSAELSRQMLDAIEDHNTALLQSLVGDKSSGALYDSLLVESAQDFDRALQELHHVVRDPARLGEIREAARYYYTVVDQVDGGTGIEWFVEVYKTPYYNLTQAIRAFVVDSHRQTVDYAGQIEQNAYRASMVGIIALAAGILVLLVFYFMVKNYFVAPVLQITKSLRGYLDNRIPFTVKVSTRDEIGALKEAITTLIETARNIR